MPSPRIYNPSGLIGGGGSGSLNESTDEIKQFPFTFSTASPINAIELSVNVRVLTVSVKITIPFDDSTSEIKVGWSGDDDGYMNINQNIPSEAGEYETNPYRLTSGVEQVILTIDPKTSSQGEGILIVEVNKPL